MPMYPTELHHIISAGKALEDVLQPPNNDWEFEQRVALLDRLIDIIRNDDSHPLAPLVRVLGNLISEYEVLYEPKTIPADPLPYLL